MRGDIIGNPCYDVKNLTNENYCFVYSQACLPGAFDNINPDTCECVDGDYLPYDSIVEHFITSAHGAFAFIANTRSGIGAQDTNAPSQAYDREFFDALYGENIRSLGKANQDSKEDNIGKINIACMRYCYYEITLFGDPEISIKNPPLPDHDLCVYQVKSPDYVTINTSISINATLYNRGQHEETNLVVNLTINNHLIASKLVTSLHSRE